MSPAEIIAALKALKARVGDKADVYLNGAVHGVSIAIYPRGISHSDSVSARADGDEGMAELFAKANALWDEHAERYVVQTIRKMALALIEITADQGRCSDAALRMKFPGEDIARFGADAVLDANVIADRGPFSIEATTGDNGAPAEDEEQAA
jgi:hypothetical protein